MNIAIIGGTHGNETVGIEVMKAFEKSKPEGCLHEFKTFLGNPLAFERGVRFVNSDLNRSFGKTGKSIGYEAGRTTVLQKEIIGNFDYLLDLHTTTSNMGLTLLLNCNDKISLQSACYLKEKFPSIKLIMSDVLNEDCYFTNAMVKSGLTIEVGAVANNVVNTRLLLDVYKMVEEVLCWDFSKEYDFSNIEYYQTHERLYYPKEDGWFIHPDLEDAAFKPINKGDPLFLNINGETVNYDKDQVVYPFFINEAAYQKDRIAMEFSILSKGLTVG
jgi:succinylglutamate desuccinylase